MSTASNPSASSGPASLCDDRCDDRTNDSANASADILDSEGLQSELELPRHDEHSIYHNGKTFKCGKACPAKQKDRTPYTWYWTYREEIYEDKQRRWMYVPCWKDKKFVHFTQTF